MIPGLPSIHSLLQGIHPSPSMLLLAMALIMIALGFAAGSMDARAVLPAWIIAGLAIILALLFWAYSNGMLSGFEKLREFLEGFENGIRDSHVDSTYF